MNPARMNRARRSGPKARPVIARPEGPGNEPHNTSQGLKGRSTPRATDIPPLRAEGYLFASNPGPSVRVTRPHKSLKPCKGVPRMSQSRANIVIHLVFSTKGRRPLLRDAERGRFHAYIGKHP